MVRAAGRPRGAPGLCPGGDGREGAAEDRGAGAEPGRGAGLPLTLKPCTDGNPLRAPRGHGAVRSLPPDLTFLPPDRTLWGCISPSASA